MRILVTGGTNGMGKGVALAAQDGNEVVVLCRWRERGESLAAELNALPSSSTVSVVACDLTRLADVGAALAEIRTRHTALDGVFVNAGLGYAAERVVTEDGLDSHFQVNYLAHFMLTLGLLELLERSERGARVIFNVTRTGRLRWDDLQMEDKWGYEPAIGQAVAAKRLFYLQLHRLHANLAATPVSFYGFQIPKTVWSNQITLIPGPMRMMANLMRLLGRFISIEECGAIMAPLFVEDGVESMARSGQLMTRKGDGFRELAEEPVILDRAAQERLWQLSLELCADEETRSISAGLGI